MKPTTMDVQELKLLIADRLDVMEFLDILGWDMFDLVEYLDEAIEEKFEELVSACK